MNVKTIPVTTPKKKDFLFILSIYKKFGAKIINFME